MAMNKGDLLRQLAFVCKGPDGMDFRLVRQVLSYEQLKPAVQDLGRRSRSLPHPFPRVPRVIDLATTILAYRLIHVDATAKPAWWFGAPDADDLATAVQLNPDFFKNHPAALDPTAPPVVLHTNISLSLLVSTRSAQIEIARCRAADDALDAELNAADPRRALKLSKKPNPKMMESFLKEKKMRSLKTQMSCLKTQMRNLKTEKRRLETEMRRLKTQMRRSKVIYEESSDEESGSECQVRLLFTLDEATGDSDEESGRE